MVRKRIIIEKFRGLNESGASINEASEMVNLVIDNDGKLVSRGMPHRLFSIPDEKLLASWRGVVGGTECFLFVTDKAFYKYLSGESFVIYLRPFSGSRACMFEFSERVYILSDVDIYRFDGGSVSRVEGYSPIIATNTDADGGCVLFEAPNMLTSLRRQLFSTDGTMTSLKLLEDGISEIVSVSFCGELIDEALFSFDAESGTIELSEAFDAGENTIEVEYRAISDRRSEILEFSSACVFGGGNDTRVFLYGSGSDKSIRRHSELGGGVPRADYFPENNFVSLTGKVITSLLRHYDRMIVFCLDSVFYSVDEIRSDSLGNVFHSYPIYALNSEKGAIFQDGAVLIDNMPTFISADGIYQLSSSTIRDERNAVFISSRVDKTVKRFIGLRHEKDIRIFDAENWGELWIASDDEVLIFNYRLDCWYFYKGIAFSTFNCVDGGIILGCENGEVCFLEQYCGEDTEIRYVSGVSELGDGAVYRDIYDVTLGGKGAGDLFVDILGDDKRVGARTRLFGLSSAHPTRRRLFFKRTHGIGFGISGSICGLRLAFIKIGVKERSKLL